ncbi:AAA family ATPase [Cupriavidus oxalaticus]|nr:AAA family ATPase [Cupriavidus oxalaticus]
MTTQAERAQREAEARQARARQANGYDAGMNGHAHQSIAVMRQIGEIEMREIKWLWPSWLARGKFTLLAGQPGAGKTTICLSLAATLTRGGTWPDGSKIDAAGHAVLWTAEDDIADTVVPRLRAMGADPARMKILQGVRLPDGHFAPFDPATDVPLLAEALGGLPYRVDLLILDPIISAISGDAHRVNDVRRNLQPLIDLGMSHGCTIIGISHFSKNSKGNLPAERVIGSQAFVAVARMVLLAAYDEESQRGILARGKSNIGRPVGGMSYSIRESATPSGIAATVIDWREYMQGTPGDLLADTEGDDGEERGAMSDAMEFLRALLESGPKPAKQIEAEARSAGHSWRTIQRAKARLKIEARAFSDGGRRVWKWGLPC